MLKKEYPYYLANEAVYANQDLPVYDKYSGEQATAVPLATPEVLDKAIAAAVEAAARASMRRSATSPSSGAAYPVRTWTKGSPFSRAAWPSDERSPTITALRVPKTASRSSSMSALPLEQSPFSTHVFSRSYLSGPGICRPASAPSAPSVALPEPALLSL